MLTGSAITDMKLTLIAGRAHQKHTEGGDFRQATYRAIRMQTVGHGPEETVWCAAAEWRAAASP